MNIHEYQAKQLLEKFGVATTRAKVASTPEEAEAIARELGDVDLATGRVRPNDGLVVKAQIHAGGEERELSKTDSKAASTLSNRRRQRAKLRIKCSAKL